MLRSVPDPLSATLVTVRVLSSARASRPSRAGAAPPPRCGAGPVDTGTAGRGRLRGQRLEHQSLQVQSRVGTEERHRSGRPRAPRRTAAPGHGDDKRLDGSRSGTLRSLAGGAVGRGGQTHRPDEGPGRGVSKRLQVGPHDPVRIRIPGDFPSPVGRRSDVRRRPHLDRLPRERIGREVRP